jgi:hypothetical protein
MEVCLMMAHRFGVVLVIETTKKSGAYTLGFRIDPEERLQEVCV